MTTDLEKILDRTWTLKTLEEAFQSTKILKFSRGECLQTPLMAGPFSARLIRQWLKKNDFIYLKSWTVFLC